MGPAEVLKIRELRKAGVPGTEVAKQFGITAANVSYIHKRKTWTHLP